MIKTFANSRLPRRQITAAGGAILVVLIVITVMSLVITSVLSRTMNTYRNVSQVASWQESIVAAEAGADSTMAELRMTLLDPAKAFSTWSTVGTDGKVLPNRGHRMTFPRLTHEGEGNTVLDSMAVIDGPPELIDGSERQWYRIRATGTTFLPGNARLTANKEDHPLRRLSFVWDRKSRQKVARPQSSRLVELIVKPSSWENAITSDRPINLNNHRIEVDSYDSRYPESSTSGIYDATKFRKNGDIATNSALIEAGSATIWGDAYTNDGIVKNGTNISGEQRTDFYQELLPISKPGTELITGSSLLSDPSPAWTSINVTPTSITTTTTLTGNPKGQPPARFKVSDIKLAGTTVLTIAPSAPGVESYVEIWLTGNLTTTGGGKVTILNNANLKIFIEGSIDIAGTGTFNAPEYNSSTGERIAGGFPARFQLLGIKPASGVPVVKFQGNGNFVGAIYAPNHDIIFGAVGQSGTFWGALSGRSISMGGSTVIHYDEALADIGHITDFRIMNWFEDHK